MKEPHETMPVVENPMSFLMREGAHAPDVIGHTILIVPGLGLPKEWYHSAFKSDALKDATIVSFDMPGQGDFAPSRTPEFLWRRGLRYRTAWVQAMYHLTADNTMVHVVAHSAGNLPAMAAWRTIPAHQRGAFISIEGNLTLNDCFATTRMSVDEHHVEAFIDELRASTEPDLKRWGDNMMWCPPHFLLSAARDIVAVCGTDDPVHNWEQVTLRYRAYEERNVHYLYGERSGYPEHHRNLFERTGTNVHEIPDSGHFPMYTNPTATWDTVAEAIRSVCA